MRYPQLQSYTLEKQLQQAILEARCYPPGHFRRQQALTAIIRLIVQSNKLWKEDTPYYADALQQTWLYFCQNVCESTTGERYNFERSSVITWLNHYLRWRLQDLRTQNHRQQRHALSGDSTSHYTWHLVEHLPAQPDIPPILQETLRWVREDRSGTLRRIHIRHRPDVTAQAIILRRLPPETRWDTLANEFSLSVSTLSSFYQRQCIPLLRKFAQTQGYL